MPSDSKFTRDENGNIAVRVVTNDESTTQSDSMFTHDENGNIAVRVVYGEGGGVESHNKGYYETAQALAEAYPSASAGDYAIVGATDTVWVWDTTTSAWKDSDTKGEVTSVNSQTGAVVLTASDVGALPSGTHIPADPVQADWNQATDTALDYIKNKPTLGTAAAAATTDFATAAQGSLADTAIQSSDLTTYITTLLGDIYPVGALYIGTQSTCPMGVLIPNSVWELVSADKALWTGDGTNANTTINAALPNIKATLVVQDGAGASKKFAPGCTVSGAFTKENVGRDAVITGSATNFDNAFDLGINAHESNSIYDDNATTVQPPAYVVNVWRRTA